jgi:hypothetical protein
MVISIGPSNSYDASGALAAVFVELDQADIVLLGDLLVVLLLARLPVIAGELHLDKARKLSA